MEGKTAQKTLEKKNLNGRVICHVVWEGCAQGSEIAYDWCLMCHRIRVQREASSCTAKSPSTHHSANELLRGGFYDQGRHMDRSKHMALVSEIKSPMTAERELVFSLVGRSQNRVSHSLSAYGRATPCTECGWGRVRTILSNFV